MKTITRTTLLIAAKLTAACAVIGFIAAVVLGPCAAAGEDNSAPAFKKECGAKAKVADEADSIVVVGSDGWLFLTRELRHVSVGKFWGDGAALVSRALKPDRADPLPAILSFHQQLKKLGIDLIIVPVPAKCLVYPEALSDKITPGKDGLPPRMDTAHQEFYEILRENDIEVIDMMPELMNKRLEKEGAMYCRQDTHWSGRACIVTAQRIAEQLKNKPWYKDVKKEKFSSRLEENYLIKGDLWQTLPNGARHAQETLYLRFAGTPDSAGFEPVAPDRGSPVILLGDSHALVFHAGRDMLARGAGLADQLALELGFAVDLIGVRGSGATPARVNLYRRGRANKDYFTNKKVIVWCFSVREFTESSGWSIVPVKR